MSGSSLNFEEPAASAPFDFGKITRVLKRRWKIILLVPMVLLLFVHTLLTIIPSSYQSSVQILLFDPQQPKAEATGQSSNPGLEFDTVAINTEIEIIRSASLALRVARELKLDEIPEFQRQSRLHLALDRLGLSRDGWLATRLQSWLQSAWLRNLGLDKLTASDDPSEPTPDKTAAASPAEERLAIAAGILRTKLRVDRIPLTYVISLSVKAHDAELAARLASAFADTYFAVQKEAWHKSLDQLTSWLGSELSVLKTRVQATESGIEKLRVEGGFDETGKGTVSDQQIAELSAQLLTARANAEEKRVRLEQARQLASDPTTLLDIPEIVASPVISQLRVQQTQLARREEQLRAKLGDHHAEVIALAGQLDDLKKEIGDEAARVIAEMQNTYEIATRRQQSVQADLQRLTDARGNSGDYVKLQELRRVAEADSKLYDSYLPQYNGILNRKSLENFSQRIISPAEVPTNASSPPRTVFYVLGGAAGLMLGLVLAFVVDFLQAGPAIGSEAERMYGYPVIGNIPLLDDRRSRSSLRRLGHRTLVRAAADTPMSPIGEAIRTVRVGVRLRSSEHEPKVLLVTSPLPGEGKSAVAALLAASGAQAGQRTVLVDCDIWGRTISNDFGTALPGLTDLLTGSVDFSAVSHPNADLGCDVIAVGTQASQRDLLASPRMALLIERLRQTYDSVVIDTPAVLSGADAMVLASLSDKILMAIDGSRNHYASIVEAFRLLNPEADRIAGIVFNKVAAEQMQRYGYVDARPDDQQRRAVEPVSVRRPGGNAWVSKLVAGHANRRL